MLILCHIILDPQNILKKTENAFMPRRAYFLTVE